jgi:hypothetical protein
MLLKSAFICTRPTETAFDSSRIFVMLYLKCTGEVQKAIGMRKVDLADATASTAPLGHWYVHRFSVGRTRCFLFMSEVTLLSFVLYQGRKPVNVQTLPQVFLTGLAQLLDFTGVDTGTIARALHEYREGLFSKTDSRKILGSMNDLVLCYGTMIEAQGGLAACDLTDTIMKINDMPQRTLDWSTSRERSLKLLAI